MLTPLALYLARRYRQRRWVFCALALVAGAITVSRTGIMMFVVVAIVFLWLRPRETRRLWPALLLAPLAIHFALPGTLGAIKQSFLPAGGLSPNSSRIRGRAGVGDSPTSAPGCRSGSANLFSERDSARALSIRAICRLLPSEHPRRSMAWNLARDGRRRLLRMALVLRPGPAPFWGGGKARRIRPRVAAGRPCSGRRRVCCRNGHLRRVRVHPGHVPDVHLCRSWLGVASRAPDAARLSGRTDSARCSKALNTPGSQNA